MDTALWTFVLEVGGGTYISQLRSRSLAEAVKKYRLKLVRGRFTPLSLGIMKQLARSADFESPVSLQGVKNVWCVSESVGKHFALLNIVRTAE